MTSYLTTPNKFIGQFAYRELGTDHDGLPLIMLTHLSATLDDWDPLFIDQLAGQNHVIAVDLPGVGASRGQVPLTIEEMASQVIEFVQLLGFSKINLLGLSMGGMIAQAVAEKKPELINRLVLAGTGPRGGQGIAQVSTITFTTMIKSFFKHTNPKRYLFLMTNKVLKKPSKYSAALVKERLPLQMKK